MNNLPQDDIFGLLSPRENKFYLIENDYEIIKLIQFLFLKYQWFSVVNLKNIHNTTEEQITNSNCHTMGWWPTASFNSLKLDFYSLEKDNKIIFSTTDADVFNSSMQEKIFFLKDLLSLTNDTFNKNKELETSKANTNKNGLFEFKKFTQRVLGNDETILEMIRQEIEEEDANLEIKINGLEQVHSKIINILNDINLKENSLAEIKKTLLEKFQEFKSPYSHIGQTAILSVLKK